MSYTIVKSDGTVLTTIADGTVNTNSTTVALPGRLYALYGQVIDTDIVHLLEHFAYTQVPANPLRGQVWFNTTDDTLRVCPTDGETNASNWYSLVTSTNFPEDLNLLGNIVANNITANSNLTANITDTDYLNVSIQANIANSNTVNATVTGNLVASNACIANISGTSLNYSTIQGSLTTNAQPNITSVGTLTSLTSSGTIAASSFAGQLANGSTNISIPVSGGNVNISSAGSPNIVVITNLGANIAGTANITGNANVGNLGATQVVASANIIAPQLISNVATGTAPLVVSSTTLVPNLNANTAFFANTAGIVTTNAQPNITSLGTLSTLSVNGNITGGNFNAVSGFFGSGAGLSNITAANVTGQVSNASVAGTVYTNAQPNITSVGTLTSLTSSGNITGANIVSTTGSHYGDGSGLYNINAANIVGTIVSSSANYANFAGNVVNASQPNITTVGTLFTLNSSGNISAPNIIANTGAFYGSGAGLTSITGANVTGQVNYAAVANSVAGGNVTGQVNYAAVANSVAGGNVSGTVANATYAGSAGSASTASYANASGVVNSLAYGQIIAALGFTPYNDTNPASYIGLGSFQQNLVQNGYCVLPNGLTLQWGLSGISISGTSFILGSQSFNTSFNNSCFVAFVIPMTNNTFNPSGIGNNWNIIILGTTNSLFNLRADSQQGGARYGTIPYMWFALGW